MISLARSLGRERPRRPQPAVGQRVADAHRAAACRWIGHHVASALLPPIRTTGAWPGARLRSSWISTGSTCARVAAGVDVQRVVLERDAEERLSHRLAARRVADAGDDRRRGLRTGHCRRPGHGADERRPSATSLPRCTAPIVAHILVTCSVWLGHDSDHTCPRGPSSFKHGPRKRRRWSLNQATSGRSPPR